MLKKQDIHISYFQIRAGFKKADLLETENQKTFGLKQIRNYSLKSAEAPVTQA